MVAKHVFVAQPSTELTLKAVVVTTAVTVCDSRRLSIRMSACSKRTRMLPGLTTPSVTEIRSTFVALRRYLG